MSKGIRGAWSILRYCFSTRSCQVGRLGAASSFRRNRQGDAFTCLVRRHGLMVVGMPSSRPFDHRPIKTAAQEILRTQAPEQ